MHPSSLSPGRVAAHYGHPDLETAILETLIAAGKDIDRLRPEDLAPIDEFHIRGRKATQELARELRLEESMQVLDVGSGLGGASRYLALEFGCRVTGLDLTEEYCRVATMLARRLGLDSRVCYRHGNALAMPFEDASFDALWTQHAAMNIPDKTQLYREVWRVLKPGGALAIYDILAGAGGPLHFPVPWAREPSGGLADRQLPCHPRSLGAGAFNQLSDPSPAASGHPGGARLRGAELARYHGNGSFLVPAHGRENAQRSPTTSRTPCATGTGLSPDGAKPGAESRRGPDSPHRSRTATSCLMVKSYQTSSPWPQPYVPLCETNVP